MNERTIEEKIDKNIDKINMINKKIRETFIIDVKVANELRRVKKENGTPMSWILNKALRKELNMGD